MSIKVLVAGANERLLSLTKSALTDPDSLVIPAPAMSLALFLAHKNLPDLIVSNFKMIDGDGWEFLKELKADDELKSIPFLFIADEKVDAGTCSNAINLGADAVLHHPLEAHQLRREIMPYINIRLAEKGERMPQTPE